MPKKDGAFLSKCFENKDQKKYLYFTILERMYTQVNTIITICHGYYPIIIGKNHSLAERCVDRFFNKIMQKILFKTIFCLNLQTKQVKTYRSINILSLYSPFGTLSVPLDFKGKAI